MSDASRDIDDSPEGQRHQLGGGGLLQSSRGPSVVIDRDLPFAIDTGFVAAQRVLEMVRKFKSLRF
jgi:hypothetical protein